MSSRVHLKVTVMFDKNAQRNSKQLPRKSCNATPESITAKPQNTPVVGHMRGGRVRAGGEGRGRGSLGKESPSRTRCQQYDAKNSYISIFFWLGADTQWPAVKANTAERLDGDSARVDPDCLLLCSDSQCINADRRFPFQSASFSHCDAPGPTSLILNVRLKITSLTQTDHNEPPADRTQASSAESSRGRQTFHPLTLESLAGLHRCILVLCRSNTFKQGKLLLQGHEIHACFSATMSCFWNKFKTGKCIFLLD